MQINTMCITTQMLAYKGGNKTALMKWIIPIELDRRMVHLRDHHVPAGVCKKFK
jgi:hypothetical protein